MNVGRERSAGSNYPNTKEQVLLERVQVVKKLERQENDGFGSEDSKGIFFMEETIEKLGKEGEYLKQ